MVDPEFPASLTELPEPELPSPSWARIEVMTGGICGSDLHLFAHNTGPSPTLASIGTFPFVLGHETAGRVVEAGAGCSIAPGTAGFCNATSAAIDIRGSHTSAIGPASR